MAGIFARPAPATRAERRRAYVSAVVCLTGGCAIVVGEILIAVFEPAVAAGLGPGGPTGIGPAGLLILFSCVWIYRISKGSLGGEPLSGPPANERF